MSAPQFRLRPARPTDLVAVVALEQATQYAPHWSPAVYAAILAGQGESGDSQTKAPPHCIVVAEQGDEPGASLNGFAVGVMHPAAGDCQADERLAELDSVVVAAEARRAGIGRALCSAVIEWCRSRGATAIVLEVRSKSHGAIALYAELGFVPAGRRPHYYRDPQDDALTMRLALP